MWFRIWRGVWRPAAAIASVDRELRRAQTSDRRPKTEDLRRTALAAQSGRPAPPLDHAPIAILMYLEIVLSQKIRMESVQSELNEYWMLC